MEVDLGTISTRELLQLWAGAADELATREVVRTRNIVGDLAEGLVHAHYGGIRASFSGVGWDVQAPDGELIQVKGLWRTHRARSKLSAIRDRNYDAVVIVVFAADFELAAAYKVPRTVVEESFAHNARVNAIHITLTKKFIADPRVVQVDMSNAYRDVMAATRSA